jgi:hypothetical protein
MDISTREQFEVWLGENWALEDATVESLTPLPRSGPGQATAEPVCLTISLQVGGSYRAGEHRTIRRLELTARGVVEYRLDPEGGFSPDHCCDGVEQITAAAPVAFEMDVPGRLRLACHSLEVKVTEHDEVVPPWLSTRELSATVRDRDPPTPREWVEVCSARGLDVVWRYYGGPPVPAAEVPPEYTGWFLQFRDRVGATLEGLFVRHFAPEPNGFVISFENHELDEPRLWRAVALFLVHLPGCTIECGNVQMPGSAWLAVLDDPSASTTGA